MNIWYGTNENALLSNIAHRPFYAKDKRNYVSVEHYYQCNKSGTFDDITHHKYCAMGASGKVIGRLPVNKDISSDTMEYAIKASFEQNTLARNILQDTEDEILTHNQDRGYWREEFPRILMKVRDELSSTPPV